MQRTEILRGRMMELEIVLSNYISFNKDEKKLGKFIEKRAKENAEAGAKEDAKTRAGKSVDNK